jgi:hypothetical protein
MDSQETLSFARKLMREFWGRTIPRLSHTSTIAIWSATIASSA